MGGDEYGLKFFIEWLSFGDGRRWWYFEEWLAGCQMIILVVLVERE